MNRYILTFEGYSKRKKKKTKKQIWDELLRIKPREFKSVKIEDQPVNNPDMSITAPLDNG
jgi:hypothetical protein